MKLIIDISDEIYNDVKTDNYFDAHDICDVKESIKNGIPFEDITNDIEQTVIRELAEDSKWALGLRYSITIINKHISELK